jgi:hypothetical protein
VVPGSTPHSARPGLLQTPLPIVLSLSILGPASVLWIFLETFWLSGDLLLHGS